MYTVTPTPTSVSTSSRSQFYVSASRKSFSNNAMQSYRTIIQLPVNTSNLPFQARQAILRHNCGVVSSASYRNSVPRSTYREHYTVPKSVSDSRVSSGAPSRLPSALPLDQNRGKYKQEYHAQYSMIGQRFNASASNGSRTISQDVRDQSESTTTTTSNDTDSDVEVSSVVRPVKSSSVSSFTPYVETGQPKLVFEKVGASVVERKTTCSLHESSVWTFLLFWEGADWMFTVVLITQLCRVL